MSKKNYNLPMDEKDWDREADHPLQSRAWEEFRKKRQPVSRVNGILVVWTRIPLTPWYFGYVPMGKWPTTEEIDKLIAEGKNMKALGIRIEPNSPVKDNLKIDKRLKAGRRLFKNKTFILDLTKSEEELLKNMHPKGRYNIRVAVKHGVVIKEDNTPEAFKNYLDLMFKGTAKRQKIYSHGRNYHLLMWNSLKKNIARLFVAEFENKIIAAGLIFKFKNGIYYAYGASALEHKEVMAPTLLLWEVARWGKSQGYKFFDLWGAEEGRGFSRFKEQFGGTLTETVGSFDLPINKRLYPIFRITEEVRWKILRLIK